MSDVKALLKLTLDAGHSTSERIESLRKLRDFLKDEEVVRELIALLATDPSVEVRRALIETLAQVDLTRLKDRNAYLEAFAREAAMEPERDLRLAAVGRLAALAVDREEVRDLLRASLEYDLDEDVQSASLAGLSSCARLAEPIGSFLADFATRAPKALRPALAAILPRLDPASGERLGIALLRPWETPAVKRALLEALAEKPSLAPASLKALAEFAAKEPGDEVRGRAIAVISDLRKVDPAVFARILDWVAAVPARAGLLDLLRHRLSSQAGLVDKLTGLFDGATSTGLKLTILSLLGKANVPALWAKALRDPSPWVRSAAIGLATKDLTPDLQAAVGVALREEPVAELRMRLATALTGVRQKGPDLERALMERLEKESDPRIGGVLAAAVAGVAVSDANRAPMLKAYRRILTDPYADAAVARTVTDRLRAFAYRDEPELVRCLTELLERATEIEKVEDLHEHLRRLQPDLEPIGDLVVSLLYRFIQHYPRSPLDGWVREIRDAAKQDDAMRARIPWVVRLTGATWALDAAATTEQGSAFLTTMLDALKGSGGYRGASNLLREAWEKRLLKKGDAAALFRRLLHGKNDGVFQDLAKILKEGKLVTPELMDASFAYLKRFPHGGFAYEIQKYLGETASADPSFKDRVRAALKPVEYSEYVRICGRPKDVKVPPRTWNDWEYSGWRTMYPDWPILKLAEEADLDGLLLETLGTPPAAAGTGTMHYAILDHFWRSPGRDWAGYTKRTEERKLEELRAFAGLAGAGGPLGDRAVLLFKKRWEEFTSDAKRTPPAELREAASAVYAALCSLHATLGAKEKAPYPPPLKQLDAARLEKLWPLDRKLWEVFKVQHLATSTPGEEAAAAKLAAAANDAMNQGRLDEVHPAIAELMSTYRHTTFVRSRAKNFEFMLDKFDPAKPVPADHEKKAESMWTTVVALAEKGDTGEARSFLNDLLQRYWRCDVIRKRKAEIDDLRKRFG